MTVAAKHFDPQLGVDIHLYEIPPDPVPVPLPTPHIGIVFDPFDYLPILGGTVQVNGIKRANAGTAGLDTHIPVGGIWMPELDMAEGPQQQDQLFMGSKTVLADGSPFSKLCMPVLDCNMIGMIPPLRLRKPEQKSMSLTLPTAVNVAIPTNVFVGGPPSVSLTALAFDAAFAGLKALRKTERFAQAMEKFRNLRKRLFGHLPDGFLKCKVLRAEPVDIRDGSVVVRHEDFAIPGRLPLAWPRKYRSGSVHDSSCGYGWQTPADIRLELRPDGCVLLFDTEGVALFPGLPVGEGYEHSVAEPIDGNRLYRQGGQWLVRSNDGRHYVFLAPPGETTPLSAHSLPIERVEDLCGNHWRFERWNGELVRIQENDIHGLQGRFIEVTSRQGRILQMQLHDPATGLNHPLAQYEYSTEGDLLAVADPLNAKRQFEYQQHQLVRHTDRNSLSFYYAYNARLQVIHAWGDGNLYNYRFRYDSLLGETEVTDSLGHVSIVKFDEYGLPLCEIDPLDGVTVFEYDDYGRILAVIDPNGLRTGFTYDHHGNPLQCMQPDRSVLAMNYDEEDRLIAFTAADGAQWQQRWNAQGLLCEQRSPLGAVTQFNYDERGQLIEKIDATGAVTRFAFERHGAIAEWTDALGHTRRFEHDALGRLQVQVDTIGQATRYRYDAKGRLLDLHGPGGITSQCEYDAEGRLVRYRDESGAETRLEYAGLSQLVRRLQPDGRSVRYHYDSEEQITGVTNQRGETYRLIRDPLGRIVEEIDYWGQSRRYDYDAGGRLCRSTDVLGRSTAFDTDALGRITAKKLPDPQEPGRQALESFRYDRAGRLVEIRNAYAHVIRHFDAEDRLTQEVQNGFAVDYVYDSLGNRIQRSSSAGNTVRIGYDALGRPAQIAINDTPPVVLKRDVLGRVVFEQLSPSLCRNLDYDAVGMLAAQKVSNGNMPLFDTSYTYDKAGNLIQRNDSEHGVDRYTYDPMGRVLEHTDPTGKIARWLNDVAGDRLQTSVVEMRMKQAVGGGQLADAWTREGSYEGRHYVFDRAGNLIRREHSQEPGRPALHLAWDANQRLAESRWQGGDRDGQRVTYGYDPLGRRVYKRNPSHTTWFFWDGDALLAEVTQPNTDSVSLREPVIHGNVIDFIAARKRIEALKNLHRQAREYVCKPGTFEPLAVIGSGVSEKPATETLQAITTDATPLPKPVEARHDIAIKSATRPIPTVTQLPRPDAYVGRMGMSLGQLPPPLEQNDLAGRPSSDSPATPEAANSDAKTPAVFGLGMQLGSAGKPTPRENKPAHAAVKPTQVVHDNPTPARESALVASVSADAPQTAPSRTIAWYHNDPNGCPIRITDSTGEILWSGAYQAWSTLQKVHVAQLDNPLRLQGQYEDAETGLYFNRHRYYEPQLGQFTSMDPLGLSPGENPYQFARNALLWIDPLGLHSTQVPYGSTDLSEMAKLHRMDHGITGGQNVAVFEYMDNGAPHYVAMASGDGLHAERRIAAHLNQLGIPKTSITRVYTELAPCPEVPGMQYCGRMLKSDYPLAQVTHSFEYGEKRASRKAGVRALKTEVRKLIGGC